MTGKKKEETELDNIVQNLGNTPTEDYLAEYTNDPDPWDVVVATVTSERKEKAKRHKTRDFTGVVMDYDSITMPQCLMETHTGFESNFSKSTSKTTDKTEVYRVKVYIPELESYLPNLSLKEVEHYHELKDKMSLSSEAGKKQKTNLTEDQLKSYNYYRKRISRFKTFYSVQDSQPSQKSPIRVRFIDDNFFYGIVIKLK